jgi:hypothetical protein
MVAHPLTTQAPGHQEGLVSRPPRRFGGSSRAPVVQTQGSSPKSVATAEGRPAREAGERGKPMAQAVGISCKRSPSPRSGRKMQARSADFSVVERAPFAAEHNRCCAFALPTDTERREPHSFARFAGFTTLTLCPPRLAPWAFIYRPLRGLARIRACAPNLPVELPLTNGVLGPAMKARRVWQERAGSLPGGGEESIEGKALLSHPLSLHFWDTSQKFWAPRRGAWKALLARFLAPFRGAWGCVARRVLISRHPCGVPQFMQGSLEQVQHY